MKLLRANKFAGILDLRSTCYWNLRSSVVDQQKIEFLQFSVSSDFLCLDLHCVLEIYNFYFFLNFKIEFI